MSDDQGTTTARTFNHFSECAGCARLRAERDAARALLRECREAYRRPWDYGYTAVVATDQRVFAAWLARLDEALR